MVFKLIEMDLTKGELPIRLIRDTRAKSDFTDRQTRIYNSR